MTEHKIRWFVYVDRERIPKTSNMRGAWGCDAVCSCGWDSRTGGATERSVRRDVKIHKLLERTSEPITDLSGLRPGCPSKKHRDDGGPRPRCMLTLGHDGPHKNGNQEWA